MRRRPLVWVDVFKKRHGNLTKGWGKTLRAPDTIKPEESETYSKNAGLGGPDREGIRCKRYGIKRDSSVTWMA